MRSSGEKNSDGQENRGLWKVLKSSFTFKAKDRVVLEDNINLPSSNLLGADSRGTVKTRTKEI